LVARSRIDVEKLLLQGRPVAQATLVARATSVARATLVARPSIDAEILLCEKLNKDELLTT